ncbi:TIGR03752 family integrating conjugative element protein [Pasteurella oralis]|uniref:TIGR03752 family integrating conjugative element protein n=1 Tax=Pasteurella oralis TaxID=1071947 RepID=UPI000C7B15A3|nr:TIGR03752 family integrating conjugative element protein [Pasteurella oralis]
MAVTKSNSLLKFGVPFVIGGLVFIGIYAFKSVKVQEPSSETTSTEVVYDLTEEEQKELNLTAGDTPHDTLKTLLGAIKQTRSEVQAVRKENELFKRENETLKHNATEVDKRIEDAVLQKQIELENDFDKRLNSIEQFFEERLAKFSPQSQTTEIPIGGSEIPSKTQEINWVMPSDMQYTDQNGRPVNPNDQNALPTFPNLFKALDDSPLGKASTELHKNPNSYSEDKPKLKPYYTIPQNSTLMGSVAMTALIGRVPIQGTVTDPFPFKIMIGQDNLMANGIELPDVQGAIVSGTAQGDWTLSCVKGEVSSITFIFNDGRVLSLPGQNNNAKSIGWLSNPQGVPCIPGDRKTNAPQYLTSQFLLSGASAAAQGLAQGQTTTVVEGNTIVGAVTGNQGKYILGQALGGGLNETTEWLRQRYGQMFDAIYAPPGQAVAVHITTSLDIDYDFNGRKVKYHNKNTSNKMD